jgi:E3 ubiquitin-protein ligase UBR4
MCPSRDGCTITLKLQRAYDHLGTTSPSFDKNEESASHDILGKEQCFPVLCDLMQHELVLVALRLLVGSTTTEFIPKYVSIEGRRVWLRPNVKKWYDLPLTADEIALGLRNGFVSIGIGPSFDSGNNPLVDAIEVYAASRGQISHWLPLTSLTSQNLQQTDKATSRGTVQTQTPPRENKLASFVLTLTHLLNVLGTDSDVTPEAHRIIRELIEATALDDDGETRQSLTSLLSCIEPDPEEHQKILDGGTLIGVLRALNSAKDMLQELLRAEGEGSRCTQGDHQTFLRDRWIRVRRTTKECLKASAAITRKRPGNYKVAIQDIMTRENVARSIAAVAGDIFAEGLRNELECRELVPDLIELLLTESMLFVSEAGNASTSFATFDTLARLLKSSNEDIVTACCESILFYWTEHLSKKSDTILYQCDSCDLFPIQGKRYTLLEGGSSSGRDSDIDLCSDCYQIGKGFAASNRADTKVSISGRTVGKNPKLSCARFAQMKPVAILTTPAEGSNTSEIATPASVSQNVSTAETAPPGAGDVLETLSSVLFNDLLQLLADNLKEGKLDFAPSSFRSLVDLVLNITKKSGDEDLEMNRAKQYAEALSKRIPHLIDIITRHDTLEAAARPLLTTCIQGLSSLVTPRADASGKSSLSNIDDCSVEDTLPAKSKKKTDPRFVCEVHGVAAVRRRCSHGANKNRRFYVCGMSRNSRCKYFKWAESEDGKLPDSSEDEKSKWTTEIERFTWELFKEPRGADSRPLHVQLCMLLELDVHDKDKGALSLPVEATGNKGRGTRASETEKASSLLSSRYDEHAAASDYVDGVFCSQEKMRAFTGQWLLEDYSSAVEDSIANQGEVTIIKATLDLLSNIAGMAVVEGNNRYDDDGRPGWFLLLCEIISSSQSSHYRALAKRVLKRLCGGNRAIYHCVRDHYVFRLHFQKLLLEAHSPLLTALNIKEQARQCGSHWKTGGKVDFDSLPAGGLIGMNDLVSEDCVTVARSKKIGAALDELFSLAKNRCMNWRNFCSLTTLPQSRRTQRAAEQDNVSVDNGLAGFVEDPNLVSAPPIISLIWIACALCGENQVKVLELIDIAMSTSGGARTAPSLVPPVGKDTVPSNRERVDPQNSDGGMDVDSKDSGTFVPGSHTSGILPSTVLLKGEKALLVDEVHGFVVQFVLEGKSPGLRKVGGEVVFKICQNLQVEELERLFVELTERALYEVAELGSTCNELFQLLQSLASSKIRTSSPQLIDVSRNVLDAFTTQMRSLRHAKAGLGGGHSTQKDVNTEKLSMERFDFTTCVNCHREQAGSSKGNPAASSSQSEPDSRGSCRTRTMPGASSSTNGSTAAWLPEQVRPFARDSLEASTDASLSSEFSTYIQLKSRLAVSDIHLTIGDPRGRYVKTIAVYFSPRPVSDVNRLKSEEYSDIWQLCATLSLSRGATRASCSLTEPVIAANLQFEYIEFYERPGGSRAADGSLLLHCPRCTRVVNNAHGVCGHCGEVAFQCRKCRHINYDRLDAFLCVECGYCSAGTFAYELTSGAASNAVAIVDDESYERTIKVLRVATKLHGEVRDALKERVRPVIGKRSLSVQKYGPALKRTFLGELPKISREKTESGEGISSRMFRSSTAGSSASRGRDDSNPLAAANRARSLLHLARQLRNDSSSERSRDGDFLIRQALLSSAGRGLLSEEIDDVDSDMIGFINASDLGGPDPLSRLVASIQGRVRMSTGRDLGSERPARPSENNNAEGGTGDISTKASSEECDRLYQLMRESERECFELQRRINAWKRLENDALADLGTESVYASLSPSQCSICSGPVTLQLLILFVELFGSDPTRVQSIITEKSILALFDELPDMDKDLFDAKRIAIVTLATKSEHASKLILAVLRTRLKASRDAASAEILGKIIAIESTLSEDFVKLAAEILESGY